MSLKTNEKGFRTVYSGKNTDYFTPAGSRMANDYEVTIDKKGHKTVKKVGEHDIYPEIQSYLEETKIENIIARAAAGDLTALNQRKGFYADISETPRDLAEAQNNILKLTNGFNKLPAEIRAKFDNSKEKFVQMYGSEEWAKIMGFSTGKAEESKDVDFVPGTTEAAKEVLTPEVKE